MGVFQNYAVFSSGRVLDPGILNRKCIPAFCWGKPCRSKAPGILGELPFIYERKKKVLFPSIVGKAPERCSPLD